MRFKALFAHAVRNIHSWGRQRRRVLAQPGAAVCLALLVGGAAQAGQCSFSNGSLTHQIQKPAQITLTPGGPENTGNIFSFDVAKTGELILTGCDQEVFSLPGSNQNVPVYFFPSTHFQYVDDKTISLGNSGLGLRIVSPAWRSFQDAPLRLLMGEISYTEGTGAVEYTAASSGLYAPSGGGDDYPGVQLELVILGPTFTLDSGDLLPLGGSMIFGTSTLGYHPNGPALTANLSPLLTVSWGAPVQVVQMSCKASDRTISLGDRPMGQGIGTVSPTTYFTVHLTECPTQVPVYYRVDPTTAVLTSAAEGVVGQSLMAIKSGTGAAEGVAIQLLYGNGEPHPLNTKLALSPAPLLSAPEYDLDLGVRYMQIASPVKSGQADASATITFSYQ
uniref:fimbrial protein n=1 Tax=Castellaniella defragrans TaxID=75697 RepID=UPI003342D6AB